MNDSIVILKHLVMLLEEMYKDNKELRKDIHDLKEIINLYRLGVKGVGHSDKPQDSHLGNCANDPYAY